MFEIGKVIVDIVFLFDVRLLRIVNLGVDEIWLFFNDILFFFKIELYDVVVVNILFFSDIIVNDEINVIDVKFEIVVEVILFFFKIVF